MINKYSIINIEINSIARQQMKQHGFSRVDAEAKNFEPFVICGYVVGNKPALQEMIRKIVKRWGKIIQ